MNNATIIQSLGAVFHPIVLAGAVIVTLAFLTGVVARFIEFTENLGRLGWAR